MGRLRLAHVTQCAIMRCLGNDTLASTGAESPGKPNMNAKNPGLVIVRIDAKLDSDF